MPAFTLFHDPTSEPSRAVHWFALETGIDLQLELTWLTRGEHRSPGFLKINPAHQVPVLKHGELCLPEASAIMLYLAELAACEEKWLGHTVEARAYTHRFLSWHHTNTRKTITLDYLLPVWLMPAYKGDPAPSGDETEQLKNNIRRSLALLEGFLGERGAYLGGKWPSIADLFIASDVFALDVNPALEELTGRFLGILRWLDRLRERQPYRVSHAPWNAVIPHIRELLLAENRTRRDASWVADICMAAMYPEKHQNVRNRFCQSLEDLDHE